MKNYYIALIIQNIINEIGKPCSCTPESILKKIYVELGIDTKEKFDILKQKIENILNIDLSFYTNVDLEKNTIENFYFDCVSFFNIENVLINEDVKFNNYSNFELQSLHYFVQIYPEYKNYLIQNFNKIKETYLKIKKGVIENTKIYITFTKENYKFLPSKSHQHLSMIEDIIDIALKNNYGYIILQYNNEFYNPLPFNKEGNLIYTQKDVIRYSDELKEELGHYYSFFEIHKRIKNLDSFI
jgi:hypothetical protein